MKESKIIQTPIGDLTIPAKVRLLIRINKGPDLGANLMQGFNEDMGMNTGYLAQQFNGNKNEGRKPFTRKEIEDFIVLCAENPKMAERFSHLLIIIMGEVEMIAPSVEPPIELFLNSYVDTDDLALSN